MMLDQASRCPDFTRLCHNRRLIPKTPRCLNPTKLTSRSVINCLRIVPSSPQNNLQLPDLPPTFQPPCSFPLEMKSTELNENRQTPQPGPNHVSKRKSHSSRQKNLSEFQKPSVRSFDYTYVYMERCIYASSVMSSSIAPRRFSSYLTKSLCDFCCSRT